MLWDLEEMKHVTAAKKVPPLCNPLASVCSKGDSLYVTDTGAGALRGLRFDI